ncbi:MAG: ABC transporter permease [Actinobacteria bacterium]|nr:ABC transporter permease [Actinomycetota bacterium]
MSPVQTGAPPADAAPPTRSLALRALASPILRNRSAIVALAVLAFFVFLAVAGPLLIDGEPKAQVGEVFEPPGREFPLGTDGGGSSMVSMLVAGARVSLLIGFAAAAISALIGGTVGILAGFFGGKTDVALMRVTDYFLVIPDIPLMIVFAALFGRSTWNIVIIIGVIYWTFTARLLRAQTKSVRERVYVQRARALGAGNSRLILRHVLPQVTPLLIANTVLLIAYAIFAETFITFLGLGDPSDISWGRLIENAFTDDAMINEAWWAIIPPGICVMLVVLACTILGQAMEDALNPRLRTGHLSVRRFRVLGRPERQAP